jgi:hypothetical protein
MEVIKLGDPGRIWHGTETCKNCGSVLRIKKYEIESRPAETWVGGIRRMVGSLRWWNCVVCGGRNTVGPEVEGVGKPEEPRETTSHE